MNTLKIGDRVHPLGEVVLSLWAQTGGERGLEFSLHADTDDLQRAGFAINQVTVPRATQVSLLVVELWCDTSSCFELAESVICEPGGTLELDWLRISFGAARDGLIGGMLQAVCERLCGEVDVAIPVLGTFTARIVREGTDSGFQPPLPLA